QQARPFGLCLKAGQAALQSLAREQPLPADCALPGPLSDDNAAQKIMDGRPNHRGHGARFKA
ncbi:hypothetical protein, partial [Pseudomonas fluorescens]|uniref:hypothetical protein n=1 Tax=Pseudomonas fluorescens TaxID=294 RepID=UPI001C83F9B5